MRHHILWTTAALFFFAGCATSEGAAPATDAPLVDVEVSDDPTDVAASDEVTPDAAQPALDVPFDPPEHDVIPISNALCEDATLLFPAAEATTQSETARFGLTETTTATMTASTGDVDADGRTDLVIGDELYLNCGAGGFVQVALPPLGLQEVSSTAILELDGDGRPDLMFGDIDGAVVLVHQQADGSFVAGAPISLTPGAMVTTLVPFPDRDRDGRPDHIYGSMYHFPPNGLINASPATFGQEYGENQASNALLSVSAQGEVTTLELPPDVTDCGAGPTMAAQYIARHHLDASDTIYFCTTWGPDCAYPISDGTPAEPMFLPGGTSSYTQMNWAMGVDHTYTDDGVMVAVSDVGFELSGRPPANLWVLGPDGLVVIAPDEPITEPPKGTLALIGWGVHFADFDLDGHTDLLYAHGRAGIIKDQDEDGEPIITWHTMPVDDGGLVFFGGTEGPFETVPEAEPPEIDDRGAYSLIVGDFYGNDGFGDGCLDAIVTSVIIPRCEFEAGECDSEEPVTVPITFEHTAALLRNRCADDGAKPFVGVRVPLSDAGATARLTWGDGSVDHRPIRSVAGLGGTVEPSAVFAIPEGTTVQALDVLHLGGVVVPVPPGDDGYSGWLRP